jgi:hypothetical protein
VRSRKSGFRECVRNGQFKGDPACRAFTPHDRYRVPSLDDLDCTKAARRGRPGRAEEAAEAEGISPQGRADGGGETKRWRAILLVAALAFVPVIVANLFLVPAWFQQTDHLSRTIPTDHLLASVFFIPCWLAVVGCILAARTRFAGGVGRLPGARRRLRPHHLPPLRGLGVLQRHVLGARLRDGRPHGARRGRGPGNYPRAARLGPHTEGLVPDVGATERLALAPTAFAESRTVQRRLFPLHSTPRRHHNLSHRDGRPHEPAGPPDASLPTTMDATLS